MYKIKSISLLLLGLSMSFPAAAKLYKWVDENGATHYGEVIPPEYANKNRSELTPAGRVVNKSEVLTPEQIKAKEDAIKKQRADEEALLDQKRRDKALLNTFSNINEIDASKARNLQQIEGMINSTSVQIKINQTKLEGLQVEANNIKAAGKKLPMSLREELKETPLRIAKQQADLERFKAEKISVEARFEADKARYRFLTTGAQ